MDETDRWGLTNVMDCFPETARARPAGVGVPSSQEGVPRRVDGGVELVGVVARCLPSKSRRGVTFKGRAERLSALTGIRETKRVDEGVTFELANVSW